MRRREFLLLTGSGVGALALGHWGCSSTPATALPSEILPGLETYTSTTCLMCPGGCGVKIRKVDGAPVGISGNPNHPINAGGVCSEGISGLQLLHHPDRLFHPLRRKERKRSNPFEQTGWEEPLKDIADHLARLRQKGVPQNLAFVLGRTGGSMEELVRHFMSSFGSPNLLIDEPQDGNGLIFELMHGIREQPAFDFDNAQLVFSFGADLLEAWRSPLQFQRSHAASLTPTRGFRSTLFVADCHFSNTAARAQRWVGVAPGSYGALALGMAYVMLRERLYDVDFAAERLYGLEDFRGEDGAQHEGFRTLVLRDYPPEVASRLTGVPVDRIIELAKAFGESPTALALFGEKVVAQPGGVHAAMAVHSLNLLKGNLNRPGGVYIQPRVPLRPLSTQPQKGTTPGGLRVVEDLAELASTRQRVDVLFLYCSNPVYSSPFADRLKAVLDRIPLIVSFSPFEDETTAFADYVLPDCLPLERWEDRLFPPTSPQSGWGIVQPAVKPEGEVRHSGEVLLDLARRLGPPLAESFPWESFEELLKHRAQGLFEAKSGTVCVDLFTQGLVAEMERRGWWMYERASFDEFWHSLLETGAWTDPSYRVLSKFDYSGLPDGKIDIFSRALKSRFANSRTPLSDVDCLPHHHASEEPRITPAYPIVLNPHRLGKQGGGTNAALPWVLQQAGSIQNLSWNSWVEINPADAEALDIKEHDSVWVESAAGRVRVRAAVYRGSAPGVVTLPCGLGHTGMGRWAADRGVNPWSLVVPERDPISGLAYRFGTRVKIYKA